MIPAAEKEQLRSALKKAFDDFISKFSSFSENEIHHSPYHGSWTPAQVATHIILATDGVPDGNTKPCDRPYGALLPLIRPWWEDLNQKFTSPEPLEPSPERRPKDAVLNELLRVRDKDLSIVDSKDMSAICLDFELPTIGYLTRYEWLWFIEMHLRRHSFQLSNMLKKAWPAKQ